MVINEAKSRSVLFCLLLGLATFIVYWPLHTAQFNNYDDADYVSRNPQVLRGLTVEGIGWAFRNADTGNWHPLTWLSHMADVQLFGVAPGAHHLVNVFLHILNVLLLFHILQRLTGAFWPSAVVAILFALHPLNVESVAWIAERKHVLSSFFWMLTIWAYVRYARRPNLSGYLLVLLFFILGLLAKPLLVTLPFVLLLLDYWPLRRITSWPPTEGAEALTASESESGRLVFPNYPLKRLVGEKIPLLIFSAGSSIVALLAASHGNAFPTFEKQPVLVRLGNALVSYVTYLAKMIWPSDLAVFYPHPGPRPLWQVIGAAVLLGLISALALWYRRRRPYFLVGWFWYLGTLVPMIGLVQVGAYSWANRYAYLSSLGLFVIIAWGGGELLARRPRLRIAAQWVGLLMVAGLIVVTSRNLAPWHDSVKLWSQALAVTSNNVTAHYGLGQALLERGQPEETITHYQKALELAPTRADIQNNLAVLCAQLGRFAEATNHYQAAIRLKPNNDIYRLNYGMALATLGQNDAAVAMYESALQLNPTNFLPHLQLGIVWTDRREGEKALIHFRRAAELQPGSLDVLYYSGRAYLSMDRFEEAIRQLKEVVRMKPDFAPAHAQLAMAFLGQNQVSDATREFREALRLDQTSPDVPNNFAWVLATHPDPTVRQGAEAVKWAEMACALTARRQPILLGTLAAAYAEAGRFNEAVAAAQEAEKLAASTGANDVAKKNRELLKLYRENKPYREAP